MRKALMAIGATAIVALSQVAPASAQMGATVVDEFGCGLAAIDSGLPVNLFTDDVTHFTESASGNVILQCHFDIPEGMEPETSLKSSGFSCATFAGPTTDSWSNATPGGKAHLRCIIH